MMKRLLVALLSVLSLTLAQASEPPTQDALAPQEETPAPTHLPLRATLTEDAIAKAVRETLADEPATPLADSQVLSGGPYREFAGAVAEARRGHCLGPDAMKHQPPKIGPIGLGGVLAIPHWLAAMARNKCNW